MNYRHVYMLIIEHAKSEQKLGIRKRGNGVYYESHHVLPKSLFPLWKYRRRNMVLLTAREHFFCHQLLSKIYDTPQMRCAIWLLANDGRHKITSKQYQHIKEEYSSKLQPSKKQCSKAGKKGSFNKWNGINRELYKKQNAERFTKMNKSDKFRQMARERQLKHNTQKFSTMNKSDELKDLQKLGRIKKVARLMLLDNKPFNKENYEEYRTRFYNYPMWDKVIKLLDKLNISSDRICTL